MYQELRIYAQRSLSVKNFLAAFAVFSTLSASAQAPATPTLPEAGTQGAIVIGGSVYGGGKSAAINTGNARYKGTEATTPAPTDAQLTGELTDLGVVVTTDATSEIKSTVAASQVNIYKGVITNVFGGGAMGRSFGVTNVLLQGQTADDVYITGRVFGAGEGVLAQPTAAAVLGGSMVHIVNATIGTGVYGGADAATTVGSTTVWMQGGAALRQLFAGSRAADIYGRTFAYLDGENALNNILVRDLFGGNDVTGKIKPSEKTPYWTWAQAANLKKPTEIKIPTEEETSQLTYEPAKLLLDGGSDENININNRNAFVYISKPKQGAEIATGQTEKSIQVQSVFVGGNGDYDYTSGDYASMDKPVLTRGFVQVDGGSVGSLYGGGNAATIKTSTDIIINNKTDISTTLAGGTSVYPNAKGYQFGRVFGGNNKEDMFIRPTWYLQEGSISDLYSGGNAGAMRYYDATTQKGGIFLAIESDKMTINNVYGGCRIADVAPITEADYNTAMATTINDAEVRAQITAEATAEMKARLKSAILAEIEAGTLTGIDPNNETAVNAEIDNRLESTENQTTLQYLINSRMDNELMAARYEAVYDKVAATQLEGEEMYGYNFQPDYAARVLIKGGTINNVYGGNDVSGLVFNGAQVEIHSSIKNNVYGAGNGDYKYWNNLQAEKSPLKATPYTGADALDPDLYFNSTSIFAQRRKWVTSIPDQYDYQRYLQALNLYRPDVKRSYVHLKGNDSNDIEGQEEAQKATTIIGGSVYCGGNSTTLGVLNSLDATEIEGIEGHMQFGSYVRAENVFMGSNGENLVTDDIMKHFTSDALSAGTGVHLSLLDPALMATYMKAVEVPIRCTTGFDTTDEEDEDNYARNLRDEDDNLQDANYVDYSTWIGSLFIGGNVGSMSYPGQFNVNFDHKIMIYDKVVAGCNKANVPYKEGQNAFFAGGLTTALAVTATQPAGTPKVKLNLKGIRLDPYWYKPVIVDGVETTEFAKHYYYEDPNEHMNITVAELTDGDKATKKGGNIYGGCYESGHVNGGVEINVNANVLYTGYEYDGVNYHPDSPYDVLSSRLSAYGGGYGLDTEIWGDVNINVNARGQILKVFGGGEKGVVGKIKRDETTGKYKYTNATDNILDVETPYNTLVQVAGSQLGVEGGTVKNPWDDGRLYDVMRVYGGGYEGHVTGHTVVKLGRAKVHSAFGGACNADIYDYSRIIVGQQVSDEVETLAELNANPAKHLLEVPYVERNLYGGNDFGGRILGFQTISVPEASLQPSDALYYTGIVGNDALDKLSVDQTVKPTDKEMAPTTVYTQSYVEYHRGKIHGNIFGGASGNYRYLETYRDMFVDDHLLGAQAPLRRIDGTPFYAPNMTDDISAKLTAAEKTTDATTGLANWRAVNSFVNVVCATNEGTRDVILGNGLVSEVSEDVTDSEYTTTTTTTTGAELKFKTKTLTGRGGIFGGSEGLLGRLERADENSSYVRLASLKTREAALAPNVFGGGYCSVTSNSLVDAFQGRYGRLFGGAFGMTFEEKRWVADRAALVSNSYYDKEYTENDRLNVISTYLGTRYAGDISKVRIHGMENATMNVFGAGANAGSMESFVELYSGKVGEVYGASLDEGYTAAANVYIPKGSDTSVKEIFGGAYGQDARYKCDVSNAFIALRSEKLDVREGKIFGGNNNNRFTRSSFIEMDVAPTFKDGDDNESYLTLFGGGKGENSVGTFTSINLNKGAIAKNVYGGSFEGSILSSPALRFYCMEEGERLPWYDIEAKTWKIAEGKSKYFNKDVYRFVYPEDDPNTMVPASERGFDYTTFFEEDEAGTITDINGKKFTSKLTPVWNRFIDAVKAGQVKVKNEDDEDVVLTEATLKNYLFEKVPRKVDTDSERSSDYALLWPGYTKYKYAPETNQYHDWTLRQLAANGKYREHVFQAERGEPGEEGYQAEKFDYYDYPAYRAKGFTNPSPLYELGQTTFSQNNTKIHIYEGALVTDSVYGAGYGKTSVVAGNTDVRLLGGRVNGSIYGGGKMGHVKPQPFVRVYANEVQTGHTSVLLTGGSTTNVYGGGLQGHVYGYAETTIGFEDPVGVSPAYQYYPTPEPNLSAGLGETEIFRPDVYRYGDPCVEQSVYGGGEKGKVDCMVNLIINNGHIGYRFDPSQAGEGIDITDPEVRGQLDAQGILTETLAKCYVENVEPDRENDPLQFNGNAFAGGYGEGANTYYTHLWMYGGVVRNSLYGGGEIASVGVGPTTLTLPTESETPRQGLQRAANVAKDIRDANTEGTPGYTHVVMVGGEVHGDVFGGGRGFTYNLERGNQTFGETKYSDGYVFGNTHVSIRGGVIGTDETLAKGQGNVFGGGNIGYVFTGAVKKLSATDAATEGYPYADQQNLLTGSASYNYIADRYYTNEWECQNCHTHIRCYNEPHACWACQKHSMPSAHYDYTSFKKLSNDHLVPTEDCRVVVTPYCRVTEADGIEFQAMQTATDNLEARQFNYGEYVPPRYLNTLQNYAVAASAAQWDKMNTDGIIIRNAVFAGGNVARGSSKVYANATTVFGNASATLNDIFYRDLITLGETGIGGLYGDGNLTFVDGYRELNITNFGTDYEYITTKKEEDGSFSYSEYLNFNEREQAYFRVEFRSTQAISAGGVNIKKGEILTREQYLKLPIEARYQINYDENDVETSRDWFWEPVVLGAYEGRMMNTIQRADFCGVFGSRISLMGAEDRIIEVPDFKLYTINRVGELSLNQQRWSLDTDLGSGGSGSGTEPEPDPTTEPDPSASSAPARAAAGTTEDPNIHGNYFGVYNIVNYLGALTSDVRMNDVRTTTSTTSPADGTTTYIGWKDLKKDQLRVRNNGTSLHKLALANGVYFEIVQEPDGTETNVDQTDNNNKKYGPITGVIELDLINVQPGAGGGYVYAKNEHRVRKVDDFDHQNVNNRVISTYNAQARTYLDLDYTGGDIKVYETSGNFVHPLKKIMDDCWPTPNSYTGENPSSGHYWYIRGNYYVYDQYVNGVAGSITPTQESINLPLSITLASRGKLDLINVQPNLYAYYSYEEPETTGGSVTYTPLTPDATLMINSGETKGMTEGTPYKLNQPITYWEYSLLNEAEKGCFVPMTYVVVEDFKAVDDEGRALKSYTQGTVLLPSDVQADQYLNNNYAAVGSVTIDDGLHCSDFCCLSNEVSHLKGYAVDIALNNPKPWNNWYTYWNGTYDAENNADGKKADGTAARPFDNLTKIPYEEWEKLSDVDKNRYYMGPTYTCNKTGIYGQYKYESTSVIPGKKVKDYNKMAEDHESAIPTDTDHKQATVEACYVTTQPVEYTDKDGVVFRWQTAGVGIPETKYKNINEETSSVKPITGAIEPAYCCTSTYLQSGTASDYIFVNELIGETRLAELALAYANYNNANSSITITAEQAKATLLEKYFDVAYYVTNDGLYEGTYYEAGKRYWSVDSWSALTEDERENFKFNYDAFDILSQSGDAKTKSFNTLTQNASGVWVDDNDATKAAMFPSFNKSGVELLNVEAEDPEDENDPRIRLMQMYDGIWTGDNAPYSQQQRVDYQAYWNGPITTGNTSTSFTFTPRTTEQLANFTDVHKSGSEARITILDTDGKQILSRQEYEAIPNERINYVAIKVDANDIPKGDTENKFATKYIVTEPFTRGGEFYTVGSQLTAEEYSTLTGKSGITIYTFPKAGTYYFCREAYTIGDQYTSYTKEGVTGTPQPVTSCKLEEKTVTIGDEEKSVQALILDSDSQIELNENVIAVEAEVPFGSILTAAQYQNVVNLQTNFAIVGTAPRETATLYIPRESKINDLSQERIVTVIYRYEFDESDESGTNIEHIIERHIINVHLNFKDGEPSVGLLDEPPLVLPKTQVGFIDPVVDKGAYEIIGGGYEIYDNAQDAIKHQNGREFNRGGETVYWYEDGNYVAYFAKTYLGKTYSNNVRIKVANYHDIADVIDDENHLFVDNPKVHRPSKIYIDNRDITDKHAGQTELDLLQNIFNLSLEKTTKTVSQQQMDPTTGKPLYWQNADKTGTATTTVTEWPAMETVDKPVFNGHARNCENLEFVLNSDVSPFMTAENTYNTWTPLGNETDGCFSGNIHGDGYTISGLDHALFGSLCGNVYNLGVTGTFTDSGIANDGYIAPAEGKGPVGHSGIISNSWIHTTSTDAKTKRPIYGLTTPNTSLNSLGNRLRLLNCYYVKEDWGDAYTLDYNYNGELYGKPLASFHNGEVAFDLNGYYLTKRYADAVYKAGDTDAKPYKFIATDPATGDITLDGRNHAGEPELTPRLSTAYYKYLTYKAPDGETEEVIPVLDRSNMGYPSYTITLNDKDWYYSYVERHFSDGDFRYRRGVLPEAENVRTSIAHSGKTTVPDTYEYYPIWPDDYIFFGQKLTHGYGADVEREADLFPTALRKTNDYDKAKDFTHTDNNNTSTTLKYTVGGRINYSVKKNNIIFRAPAYYRNADMNNVFFNAYAVFADHVNGEATEKVHHNLTAVDFTGHNDLPYLQRSVLVKNDGGTDEVTIIKKPGYVGENPIFYPPVLNFTKLVGLETHDLTQNLLFYSPAMNPNVTTPTTPNPGTEPDQSTEPGGGTPAPKAAPAAGEEDDDEDISLNPTIGGYGQVTYETLRKFANEPTYAEKTEVNDESNPDATIGKHSVDMIEPMTYNDIQAHVVVLADGKKADDTDAYTTLNDHFLVDAQDYFAPIQYNMGADKRMWYQRWPKNYAGGYYDADNKYVVDTNAGWDAISLPFTVDMVTTQTKGEITHFYKKKDASGYNRYYDSGHEYWLREFTGTKASKDDDDNDIIVADMTYPISAGTDTDKTYDNTFLWDYYYSRNSQKDKDDDKYQNTYYREARVDTLYARGKANTPYIVGFPGERYYEFDLSGHFKPNHTTSDGDFTEIDEYDNTVAKLKAQGITYASAAGGTVPVSDMTGKSVTYNGKNYTFKTNFLNDTEADNSIVYVLNDKGSAFDSQTVDALAGTEGHAAGLKITAFQPYFLAVAGSSGTPAPRRIVFGMSEDSKLGEDEPMDNAAAMENLIVRTKKGRIIVESELKADRPVRIVSVAGQLYDSYTICPGERVETAVAPGIYLVNRVKVIVK